VRIKVLLKPYLLFCYYGDKLLVVISYLHRKLRTISKKLMVS